MRTCEIESKAVVVGQRLLAIFRASVTSNRSENAKNAGKRYLVSLGGVDLDVLSVVVLGEGGGSDGVQQAIILEQSTDICNHV